LIPRIFLVSVTLLQTKIFTLRRWAIKLMSETVNSTFDFIHNLETDNILLKQEIAQMQKTNHTLMMRIKELVEEVDKLKKS